MPKKIDPAYRKLVEQVKVDGEKYAEDAMKPVYLEQKAAMGELHDLIGKAYINHAKDGVITLTTAQQRQLMTGMKSKLKAMGLKLGQSEIDQVTLLLSSVFSSTYYKNAFVMESGLKANIKFNLLKKEFIQAAVNAKYKGEFFSDRIWSNKAGMIDHLQDSLTKAMQGKMTIDKIGREIRDRFNVTAYESRRLVATETSRVQTRASIDIGKSSGVEQHMWSATLDGKTSPECAEQDGKLYDINDGGSPQMPLHPLDRCCWINVPYEGWSPSARKDNQSGEIIAYINYEDWAKAKGVN